MIRIGTKQGRQAAAIAFLLLAMILVWTVLIQPIIAVPLSRAANVAALSNQVATLALDADRRPALERALSDASEALAGLHVIWHGESRAQIAATMQDALRTAAQQGGGQVISTSRLNSNASHVADTLSVRARINGTLETVQHVLGALDASNPRLFVDSLQVNASDGAGSSDQPPQLSFELAVSGYLDEARADAAKP